MSYSKDSHLIFFNILKSNFIMAECMEILMEKSKTVCVVCFDEIEHFAKCSEQCDDCICYGCLEQMILYHRDNSIVLIPKCPVVGCFGEYLFSSVRKLSKSTFAAYDEICAKNLSMETHDEKMHEKIKTQMLNQLRKQKLRVVETFPEGIQQLIKISLSTKLRSIMKSNLDTITRKAQEIKPKKCVNYLCNGVMTWKNESFTCNVCDTKLCKNCNEILKPNHVCKTQDVESVNYVKSLVSCPKCGIPAEKSFGCNNMTCPVCRTNFDFVSGKIVMDGNHDPTQFDLKKNYHLTELTQDQHVISLLERIEILKPKIIQPSEKLLASKRYERIVQMKKKCKIYSECVNSIVEKANEKLLTIEFLEQVLTILN